VQRDEKPVLAGAVVTADRPPDVGPGEPVRAETALGGEQEREHAAGPDGLDPERLAEEDDPRRGELVEREAAAALVLGGAAVAQVAAAQRCVHRIEDQVEPRDASLPHLGLELRESRTERQWIRDVTCQGGSHQRARRQARLRVAQQPARGSALRGLLQPRQPRGERRLRTDPRQQLAQLARGTVVVAERLERRRPLRARTDMCRIKCERFSLRDSGQPHVTRLQQGESALMRNFRIARRQLLRAPVEAHGGLRIARLERRPRLRQYSGKLIHGTAITRGTTSGSLSGR